MLRVYENLAGRVCKLMDWLFAEREGKVGKAKCGLCEVAKRAVEDEKCISSGS